MAEVAALEHLEPAPPGGPAVAGRSPWALAGRRLARNRIALGGLALFILIVVVSFAAPLYADHIAHVNPFQNNLNGHTIVNGKRVPLMQQGGGTLHLGETPIGPTWDVHHYFLGADQQGRDVAARLLYGGRDSLLIGTAAALITCLLATLIGALGLVQTVPKHVCASLVGILDQGKESFARQLSPLGEDLGEVKGPDAGAQPAEPAPDVHETRGVAGRQHLGSGAQDGAHLVGQHRGRGVSVLDREGAAEPAALVGIGQFDEVDAADVGCAADE